MSKLGQKLISAALPDYREIELPISRDIIVAQVAAFLYAAGYINDDEEVTNIQFKELFGASDVELCPLKVFVKKNQEVEVFNY